MPVHKNAKEQWTGRGKQIGIVSHYNAAKGLGFIRPSNGGQDLYVHKSQVVDGPIAAGVEVTYEPTWQRSNRVALNVTRTPTPVAQAEPDAQGTLMVPDKVGTVTRWDEERGMGTITPEDGSQDFFTHRSALLEGVVLSVGSYVTFEPSWDARKGKPMALRVGVEDLAQARFRAQSKIEVAQVAPQVAALAGWGPASVDEAVGALIGAGCRASPYGGASGSTAVPATMLAAISTHLAAESAALVGTQTSNAGNATQTKTSSGTVKMWEEKRGMGFITPADGGADVFVHRSNLSEGSSLVVGASVTYEPALHETNKKLYALNVRGATPHMSGSAVHNGGNAVPGVNVLAGTVVHTGNVSVWFEDRGVGYIAPSDGGEAVFVHRNCCQDGLKLSTGLAVTFQATLDPATNKPLAWSVSK